MRHNHGVDSVDLARLSDFDFELVCRDLFEDVLGVSLEIFTRGADGGVDLRHLADDGASTVIQCKHWIRSGAAALLRHMQNIERPKVAILNPERYILLTSASLSVAMKSKLRNSLRPHVRSPGDIYGAEQLVEELRKRPDVVRRHFKLWLSGTAVLQGVLNKEILLRSSELAEEAQLLTRTFVPTPAYEAASAGLAERSVCLIVGIPGIGKTATAMMLAASYLAEGYELVEVSRDAEEIDKAWEHKTKQFFYYDDFLGQTTLGDKLNKNEDQRLLNVIQRIQRSQNKKLVLTTREYILNQALQRHERLDATDLRPLTFYLGPRAYSTTVKAKILYNLVYYADISPHEKRRFAEYNSWRTVIDHNNFNPRIIERTLATADFGDQEPINVVDEMVANLDNPERIWRHIVEYELDDAAIHLLEVLFTFGDAAPEPRLQQAWEHYRAVQGVPVDLRAYHRNRRLLEGTMTRTSTENSFFPIPEDTSIRFHNPSIRDYMLSRITNRLTPLAKLLESIHFAEQMSALLTSATGTSGSTLLSHLETSMDTMLSAIDRAMAQPLTRRSRATLTITTQGLALATAKNYPRLATLLMENIHRVKLGNASIDDLAELATQIESCHLLPNTRSGIIEGILEEIVDRGRSWDDLQECTTTLENLHVSGAEDRLQDLHDEMFDEATSILEPWASGKPEDYDIVELEAAVEFIDNIYLMGDEPPGLDEARAAVENQYSLDSSLRYTKRDAHTSLREHHPAGPDEIEQLRCLLADYQDDVSHNQP